MVACDRRPLTMDFFTPHPPFACNLRAERGITVSGGAGRSRERNAPNAPIAAKSGVARVTLIHTPSSSGATCCCLLSESRRIVGIGQRSTANPNSTFLLFLYFPSRRPATAACVCRTSYKGSSTLLAAKIRTVTNRTARAHEYAARWNGWKCAPRRLETAVRLVCACGGGVCPVCSAEGRTSVVCTHRRCFHRQSTPPAAPSWCCVCFALPHSLPRLAANYTQCV